MAVLLSLFKKTLIRNLVYGQCSVLGKLHHCFPYVLVHLSEKFDKTSVFIHCQYSILWSGSYQSGQLELSGFELEDDRAFLIT